MQLSVRQTLLQLSQLPPPPPDDDGDLRVEKVTPNTMMRTTNAKRASPRPTAVNHVDKNGKKK